MPSTWHRGMWIRPAVLGSDPGRRRLQQEDIEAHLELLTRTSSALGSVEGWTRWWIEMASLLRKHGVAEASIAGRRAIYEPAHVG